MSPDLLASYWTISAGIPLSDKEYSPFDFKDRVEAAARAGFKGIGIWHADLDHILERRSLKEMKRILDDNGMAHVELECLTDWFMEGERKRTSDIQKHKLLNAAEALRARHVKVSDFYQEKAPMMRLIEAFAGLCAEAAEHGTRIGFELMPFAMIQTLPECLQLVEGAAASNGGISFDLWHLSKLKIPYSEVAQVPQKYVISVEINDGTFEAPWDLLEDTLNHRRLCGEGEFAVKDFVRRMLAAGYDGPWGIEVLSQELRKLSLPEMAKRAFETTRGQFA